MPNLALMALYLTIRSPYCLVSSLLSLFMVCMLLLPLSILTDGAERITFFVFLCIGANCIMRTLWMMASAHRRTLAATLMLALCAGLLFFPNLLNARAALNNANALSPLYGSAPQWTRGAHVVGPHSAADTLTVGMMLKTSHQAELQNLTKSLYDPTSSTYHRWLKAGAFNAQFGPSSSDIAAATNYLTQSGLHITTSTAGPMMLFATGSTAQVASVFHTQINDYTLTNGATYYANASNVLLPSYLQSSVLGVYGLNSFDAYKSSDMIESTGTGQTPHRLLPMVVVRSAVA